MAKPLYEIAKIFSASKTGRAWSQGYSAGALNGQRSIERGSLGVCAREIRDSKAEMTQERMRAVTPLPSSPTRRLARVTFLAFLFTFLASRTLVILIMTRTIPDMFLHVGGTHVHHLNYGIFLLAAVAGVLLFTSLNQTQRTLCALVYGVGMALTFDEFGMWLHLGGSYWQRASFDAVVVVLSLLGLLAFAPRWAQMRAHHFAVAGVVLVAVLGFSMLLKSSLAHAQERLRPWLLEIEKSGPD